MIYKFIVVILRTLMQSFVTNVVML
jgi:hypothetical protein